MPPIFKALATVTAWILWICGLAMAIITLICMGIRGDLFSSDPLRLADAVAFALSMGGMILAVAAMLIRKKLE